MAADPPRLLIGIVGSGVLHAPGASPEPDLDTRFRMVKQAGVFDYYDKTPLPGEADAYRRASERHGLPLLCGGFYYTFERDRPLLEWHLRQARALGTRVHNVQLLAYDSEGRPLNDDDVAQAYLWAAARGREHGVQVCFEVHINMWSEQFGRVARVADLVAAQGGRFQLTLDASHVIFKIDNPAELARHGLQAELDAGRVVLDPAQPSHVCGQWLQAGLVTHAHARPAVPNNPVNLWATHPDGSHGRGIQYPFQRPAPGQWHSAWAQERLEPWKAVMRQLLARHAAGPGDATLTISTEIIPFTDYGANARYSLFDDSVALAGWLRAEWSALPTQR